MKKQIGWGLVITGTLVQIAESSAKASALLNNTQFSASTIGAIVAPIEQYTPLSLGWTLLAAGAITLTFCK